jgi:hypothetical protein
MSLISFAELKQHQVAILLQAHPDVTILWDRPQMIIAEQRICVRKDEGEFCSRQRIDIVDNSITFVPRQEASLSQAVECGIRLGMFETVAEALWISQSSLAPKTVSPLATFDRSRIEGKPWKILQPKQDFSSLTITPEDREWIRRFEDPSHLVIAPEVSESVPLLNSAWWSLNPKTGTILGRASGGRGEAWSEFRFPPNPSMDTAREVVESGIVRYLWVVVAVSFLACVQGAYDRWGHNLYHIGRLGVAVGACLAVNLLGGVTLAFAKFIVWWATMIVVLASELFTGLLLTDQWAPK